MAAGYASFVILVIISLALVIYATGKITSKGNRQLNITNDKTSYKTDGISLKSDKWIEKANSILNSASR